MIQSRSTSKRANATNSGRSLSNSGQVTGRDGEEIGGVGSSYSAVINERTNKSLNRNGGPSGDSVNKGMVPTVTKSVRKTGRI